VNPALDWLGEMSESEFNIVFNGSPVRRAKFSGFRRNVAIAMGNSGLRCFLTRLEVWAQDSDTTLAEAAKWAIAQIGQPLSPK